MKRAPWPSDISDPYHVKLDAIWRHVAQIGASLGDLAVPRATGDLFEVDYLKDANRRAENVRDIRRRSRTVYLGDDTVLCRVLGRYKMYVAASDVGFGAHAMLDGYWEFGSTEFVARHVGPGMTVLDVGANFGYYTLLMADLVGPSGKLVAFEPNPVARQMLDRSIAINGFSPIASLNDKAVWDVSGQTLTFRVPENEPKNARVTVGEAWSGKFSEMPVGTLALDDLDIGKVDFIKADIEGAEQRMWAGMQKLLARNPDTILFLEFACGRCVEPRVTLEQMQALYPLRYLDEAGVVRPASVDMILSRPDDWMLVLSRQALSG